MEKESHLDVKEAVQRFLSQFERLSRLPFIADSEMEQLYGQEVTRGLAELNRFNQEKRICRNCQDRCCRLVDCELYSEAFSGCPVYPYRPVLCRMHFCNKFALEYPFLVKDLGDIFLDGLLAAQSINNRRVELLDSPPLSRFVPDLIAELKDKVTEVKENRLSEAAALEMIQSVISSKTIPYCEHS
jgi:hypothetical protein